MGGTLPPDPHGAGCETDDAAAAIGIAVLASFAEGARSVIVLPRPEGHMLVAGRAEDGTIVGVTVVVVVD